MSRRCEGLKWPLRGRRVLEIVLDDAAGHIVIAAEGLPAGGEEGGLVVDDDEERVDVLDV